MNANSPHQQGAVAIYIALLAAAVITSAAIALSGVLSLQLRLVRDIISSERAFYAADSGVEEAQYELFQRQLAGDREGEITIEEGEVSYDNESATYSVNGKLVSDPFSVFNCIASEGFHSTDRRRITISTTEGCEF